MVNKTLRKTVYAIAATAFGSTFLVGCVDNSYDLSKDMDLNATIGGQELNLPVSSTAALTKTFSISTKMTALSKKRKRVNTAFMQVIMCWFKVPMENPRKPM